MLGRYGRYSLPTVLANGELTYEQLIATTAPLVWTRFRDSASPAVNSGSLGAALDFTATAATFSQTGKLGANEAASCNGGGAGTTRFQAANNATLAGLLEWEMAWLVNPASAGEGNQGKFFCWGNGFSDSVHHLEFSGALTGIRTQVWNAAGTSFASSTTTGLTASTWALVGASYSDSGDRKIHLYKNGVEFAYASQQALTGTYKVPSQAFNLMNTSNQTLTFDGLIDEYLAWGSVLSSTVRQKIAKAMGF